MKLKYRGNSYDYNPQFLKTTESEITAKYRGVTYKVKRFFNFAVPSSIVNLKCRGVAYVKGQKYGTQSTEVQDKS
ncbi:MAG: DUF4278 domain-containing protein [Coleofasciculaceae cyanobacterium]